jgi:hypothetical protein
MPLHVGSTRSGASDAGAARRSEDIKNAGVLPIGLPPKPVAVRYVGFVSPVWSRVDDAEETAPVPTCASAPGTRRAFFVVRPAGTRPLAARRVALPPAFGAEGGSLAGYTAGNRRMRLRRPGWDPTASFRAAPRRRRTDAGLVWAQHAPVHIVCYAASWPPVVAVYAAPG